MTRVAVLDDYQGTVLGLPDWRRLAGRARVEAFHDTLKREDAIEAYLDGRLPARTLNPEARPGLR